MSVFSLKKKLAVSVTSLVSVKTDIHVLSLENVYTKQLQFIQSKQELTILSTGYSAGVHPSESFSLAKPIMVIPISLSVAGFGMTMSYKPANELQEAVRCGPLERISSLIKRCIRETILPLETVLSGYDAWSCSNHLVTVRKDITDIMAM